MEKDPGRYYHIFLPQKQHGLSKPIKMTWKPILECLGLDFDLEITWPKLKSHF